MTREEAVKILKECRERKLKYTFYTLNEYQAATDMAIKALEQEPCEDAISRAEVLDLIDSEDPNYEVRHFKEDVECLLPVTPQPKTGRWEFVQYDGNPNIGNWHCSECRSVVIECVNKEEKSGIPLYKYCPQCGARMVETQESEDKE